MANRWTETGSPFFAVTWEETTTDEEGEEDDTSTYIDMWLFRSKAEAEIFIAEEIWDRTQDHKDNLPPAHVRDIQEALQAGYIFPLDEPDGASATELWTWGTETYYDDIPGDEIETFTPQLTVRG